jgi:hypothetical protein
MNAYGNTRVYSYETIFQKCTEGWFEIFAGQVGVDLSADAL